MSSSPRFGIDRYTLLTELAPGVRQLISHSLLPLAAVMFALTIYLAATHSPGLVTFVLTCTGTCIVLSLWAKQGTGVPLLPVIAIQHLVVYGLPVIDQSPLINAYPVDYLHQAGIDLLIFFLALAAGWLFGMRTFSPSSAISYALRVVVIEGSSGLRRVGYGLIALTTVYYVLQSMDMLGTFLGMLPSGADSLFNALISAAGMCGFFVISLGIGSGEIDARNTGIFWALFTVNCLLSSAALLLSACTSFVATVFIGLFWGSNRVPWLYTGIVIAILGFLSFGKYDMRDRYWSQDEDLIPSVSLPEMPARYIEWVETSVNVITAPVDTSSSKNLKKDNSLFARVNNLQSLLFVIDAMDREKIAPLYGATYTLIPPLLIPRIFWPEKPRTHEGQVLLNVHFGRQDLVSSYRTYIAWGLLPEAYGNFGPYLGAGILGLFLGAFIAWIENISVNKLVLSLEGFLVFTLFLNMTASFEMVASVLVTSIFQSLVPIVMACMPFVARTSSRRPEETAP